MGHQFITDGTPPKERGKQYDRFAFLGDTGDPSPEIYTENASTVLLERNPCCRIATVDDRCWETPLFAKISSVCTSKLYLIFI